jgi:hypothetical protein
MPQSGTSERRNRRRRIKALITWGQLASTTEATKWPTLALAGKPDEPLRNTPKEIEGPKSVVARRDRHTMNRISRNDETSPAGHSGCA